MTEVQTNKLIEKTMAKFTKDITKVASKIFKIRFKQHLAQLKRERKA